MGDYKHLLYSPDLTERCGTLLEIICAPNAVVLQMASRGINLAGMFAKVSGLPQEGHAKERRCANCAKLGNLADI